MPSNCWSQQHYEMNFLLFTFNNGFTLTIQKFPSIYLLGDEYSSEDIEAFLEELLRMRTFSHPNVLSMLGFVMRDNKPYAVLPYMKHGDLKTYISDAHNVSSVYNFSLITVAVIHMRKYLYSSSCHWTLTISEDTCISLQ